MKKSEMNDIQKANYEYLRSLGIKKSWAKRFVEEGNWYADEIVKEEEAAHFVVGFQDWAATPEGCDFWINVEKNSHSILEDMSYHQALLEIPNNLVKIAE